MVHGEHKPEIKLVEVRTPYDVTSGSPRAASLYDFRVGAETVTVEVHLAAVRTRDGQMPPEKVRDAAKAFLELQAEHCGWDRLPKDSVLSTAAMDVVINRLGWPPRFGRKVPPQNTQIRES